MIPKDIFNHFPNWRKKIPNWENKKNYLLRHLQNQTLTFLSSEVIEVKEVITPSVVREVKRQQPFWNGSLGHVHKGISPLTSHNFPLTSLNSLGKYSFKTYGFHFAFSFFKLLVLKMFIFFVE